MEQEPKDLRSLNTPWVDQSDDQSQDIAFRGTINYLYLDVERDQLADGLAERPERDLRDNKRFAELRNHPWKLELAVLMVFFARSSDFASDTWPYERFDDKLNMGGTPIPDDLDVAQAIEIVAADLRRLAPATPKKMAWYEANIERPLAQRATQTRFGASHIDDAQHDTWLRGRTIDADLEDFSVTAMDIQRAPIVLARWRQESESLLAPSVDWHGQATQAADRMQTTLQWRVKALVTSEVLATRIAEDARRLNDFRTWIRDVSERSGPRDDEAAHLSVLPIVTEAAKASNQVSEKSSEYAPHCRLAASLYLRALGIARNEG